MYKLTLLLISLLFLSSCTIDWNDEKDAKITELEKKIIELEAPKPLPQEKLPVQFLDTHLGVGFESFYENESFRVDGNTIFAQYPQDTGEYVSVFYVGTGETVEERIQELIQEKGGDPAKCIILSGSMDGHDYTTYTIDRIDKNITYTADELAKIKQADIDVAKDGGVFDGELQKREIYNQHVTEDCSEYAKPAVLATSKTYGAYFIFNGDHTLIFHPGGADPSFIKYGTLKLSDPQ